MALAMCHTAAMMLRGWLGPEPCHLEPYEAGWASEAVAYLCVHDNQAADFGLQVVLETSVDGLRWAALRSLEVIGRPGVYRERVEGFGNWLRARLTAAEPCCADFYWVLK